MRLAWPEKSKGRVRRIRKIHDRQVVSPAVAARAFVSKANHCGVAITGINQKQLVTSCLAKQLHGNIVTMMLVMAAGNALVPVYDSFAPVCTLTHALWDTLMPLEEAQQKQLDNARLWGAVQGLSARSLPG